MSASRSAVVKTAAANLFVASPRREVTFVVVEQLRRNGYDAEGMTATEPEVPEVVARYGGGIVAVHVDRTGYLPAAVGAIRERVPHAMLLAYSRETSSDLIHRVFAHGANAWVGNDGPGFCDEVLHAVRSLATPQPVSVRQPDDALLAQLSRREREVLGYIADAMDNLKIAAHLGVCERTVKTHVSALYRKLGKENRTELALVGLKLGLNSRNR